MLQIWQWRHPRSAASLAPYAPINEDRPLASPAAVGLPDNAFDNFTRCFAADAPRRNVLKALLAVIAGGLAGPELLTGCWSSGSGPTPTRSPSPSPSKTPISECPPDELERCCTPAQVKACENAGSAAFGDGMVKCAAICGSQTASPSQSCQACRHSATNQALDAYQTCKTNTCLTLSDVLPPEPSPSPSATATATSAASGAAALQLVAVKDPPRNPSRRSLATFNVQKCDHMKVMRCRSDADFNLELCLEAAIVACGAAIVKGNESTCVYAAGFCFTKHAYDLGKCLRDDGCSRPGNTFCATGDVCCPLGGVGCGGTICILDVSHCCKASDGTNFGCVFDCCGDGCLPTASSHCCHEPNGTFSCNAGDSCCTNPAGATYCGNPKC
jgi:hypothetical protein